MAPYLYKLCWALLLSEIIYDVFLNKQCSKQILNAPLHMKYAAPRRCQVQSVSAKLSPSYSPNCLVIVQKILNTCIYLMQFLWNGIWVWIDILYSLVSTMNSMSFDWWMIKILNESDFVSKFIKRIVPLWWKVLVL